jgi:hypothetical protein
MPLKILGKRLWLCFSLIGIFALLTVNIQAQDALPHLVVYANDAGQVIALNPADGTQTTLLGLEDPLQHIYGFYPSPDGTNIAIFVRFIDASQPVPNMRIYVVTRAGEILLDQNVLPEGYTYPESESLGDPQYEMTRALGEVLWSPDGRFLAFIAAHTGNAEAFLFEPATRALTQVHSDPNTAAFLNWSPNSSTLLFAELVSFGSGGGYSVESYFAAAPGGEVRPVPLPEPSAITGLGVVGWRDSNTLVYAPLNFVTFGASGLYTLNLASLESTELLPTNITMNLPVMDAGSGTLAFVVPEVGQAGLVPGAYLWPVGAESPTLLQTGAFYDVQKPREGLFQFEAAEGSFLIEATGGALTPLPRHDFGAFVSPAADAVAVSRTDGVYVSSVTTDNAVLVWAEETQVPIWSPDGTRYYSFGFLNGTAGLIEVNVTERTTRILDERMAVNSPRAVIPGA